MSRTKPAPVQVKEPFLSDAASLCVMLRKSWTGESKLKIIRDLLAKNPDATAEEAYAALEADPQVPQKTLDKARSLIDTGVWHDPTGPVGSTPVEEMILAMRDKDRQANAAKGIGPADRPPGGPTAPADAKPEEPTVIDDSKGDKKKK